MRGVLALAAAVSLPRLRDDGSPFPQRELIIFLTFCVILVTLVVQGLTLPLLIRKLGLCEADPLETVEREARKRMLRGALDYLESVESDETRPDEAVWLDVMHHYKDRYAMVDGHKATEEDPTPKQWSQMYDLNNRVRAAERAAAGDDAQRTRDQRPCAAQAGARAGSAGYTVRAEGVTVKNRVQTVAFQADWRDGRGRATLN